MGIIELTLISFGLAMDACAVSICKGLSVEKTHFKNYLCVGLWFGIFQAIMPLIGYYIGVLFADYITNYDHFIAFGLLTIVGANMVKESFSKKQEEINNSFAFSKMFVLAIATSIDALAVGVSFSVIQSVNIWLAILLIGTITFVVSCLGLKIGNVFGEKYKNKAEFIGGLILILIGIKILLEHLGLLVF